MHRTQISLEADQYRRLGEEARRQGTSISAVIRGLVDSYFGRQQGPPDDDPLESIIGMGAGTGEPVGREHNRFIYGKDSS